MAKAPAHAAGARSRTGGGPATRLRRALTDRLEARLGGPARTRVILLLAAVVALENADAASVGAVAAQLERAFHINHLQIGLVAGVPLLVGAAGAIPFGVLADRVTRVRLLAAVVASWSVAMVATGAAQSYGWLLLSRIGLGAAVVAAMPLVASLTGDLFRPEERARIYGYILTGEFLGTAAGFLVGGNLAAAASWRWAFWVLVIPGALLVWLLLRHLPEPARGGAERLDGAGVDGDGDGAHQGVVTAGVAPDRRRVRPVGDLSLRQAVRWILDVPTNITLIVASALGYLFLAGLKTFGVSFLRGDFGLGQSVATTLLVVLGIAAVGGVLAGGRVADRLVARGHLNGRILVPAVAYAAGAVLLLPGLLAGSLGVALVFFALGAAMLSASNPPLDAARLDIMPSALWGRAESVRVVLRQSAQAGAPLLFGAIADALGGTGRGHVGGPGLRYAFLIMLSALVASAAVTWRARRSYPRDVATAVAAEHVGSPSRLIASS